MKSSVVGLLGMSPPVITCFLEGFWEPVSDIVVLYTEEEEVKSGLELIKTGLEVNYPKVRFHGVRIPFKDVTNEEDTFKFMRIAAETIRDEKDKYNCEKVYLNVSGGRKNMGISFSVLGQIMGVDGIFHIVSEDVKIVNQQLEALREDIRKLRNADADKRVEMYAQKRREFDSLLFPDRRSFKIIRIPVLPYPRNYLINLIKTIRSDIGDLSTEEKLALFKCGILDKTGGRYYISDFGKKFTDVILGK